jgi:hypothetical protein
MPKITLTQTQIDSLADACNTAVNEHARFLEDDVRRELARALKALGKGEESSQIEPCES